MKYDEENYLIPVMLGIGCGALCLWGAASLLHWLAGKYGGDVWLILIGVIVCGWVVQVFCGLIAAIFPPR